jgi:hypothetical protein
LFFKEKLDTHGSSYREDCKKEQLREKKEVIEPEQNKYRSIQNQ